MIKKVIIENYGPFKDVEINLENKLNVVHIIGMNDVGKTVLLNAIKSPSSGLNKKFGISDETNVQVTFNLSKKNYSDKIIKDMSDATIDIFEGDITFSENSSEFKTSIDMFFSTNEIEKYTMQFIEKINGYLTQNNKINDNNVTDKELDQKYENINKKSNKNSNDKFAWKLIDLFKEFKNHIYKLKEESILMMSADSNDHFDFIKSSYTIKDTTDNEGKIVRSDWDAIKKILLAFFNEDIIKNIKNIIDSDSSKEDKRKKLGDFEDNIRDQMSNFYKEHFPSQNKDLKFQFNIDSDNQIYLNVKDSTSKEYLSLSNRSDGFKWFLSLFIMIKNIKKNNSIVLIDEPEKFLHAAAQKELTKLFKKIKLESNIQIIYVTHSIFMLSKDIFPSLKIIVKENEGSKIFNNISSFINSNREDIKDVMLPVSLSLGIDIFELAKLKKIKKLLLVEGEADLYTIKLAFFLQKKDFNFFIMPMGGKENPYGIAMAKLMQMDFKILLDKENTNDIVSKQKVDSDKIKTIDSFFINDHDIKDPEDMLSNETKRKYMINQENKETQKIEPNHKGGWQKLHEDVVVGTHELEEKEGKLLKEYWLKIEEWLK